MSESARHGGAVRKTLLIAGREYLDNVRTKTFWIGIAAVPVLFTLALLVPLLLEKTREARSYAVLDESGFLLDAVEERAGHDDALRLLRLLAEQAEGDDPRLELLPPELRALAAQLEGLSPDELETRARFLAAAGTGAGLSGLDAGSAADPEAVIADIAEGLPPEARERLAAAATAFIEWRLSLTAEEARRLEAGLSRERFVRVNVPDDVADPEEWMRSRLESGDLFAYFVIGPDPVEDSEGSRYVSTNLTDDNLKDWFERLSSEVVRDRRLDREGIDDETAAWIDRGLRFEGRQLGKAGEVAEVGATDVVRQFAPAAFVYLLWIAIFTVANMLLTNTIEEKSNRIIEVLLSSVSPLQLMAGKIVGIAGTGLTVVGSWVVWAVLAIKLLPVILGAAPPVDLGVIVSEPAYLLSFVSYFLLGYLLYASVLVGVGSIFNSLKEAQNLVQPLLLVMMIPLLMMIFIVENPNGTLAKVMSWVPPFTPFVMMNRAAGPPAPWEYVGTTILLILSIAVATWLAGRIFRFGILMTGKPPKISEILRWAAASKSVSPERRG